MSMKFARWAAIASLAFGLNGAFAAFPERAVTMVVPFGAGTSVDVHARDLGQALAPIFEQTVVIDNRAGAEGVIGAAAVLRAPADGHTLMFTSSSIPVLTPVMKKGLLFDPVKDFTPICTVGRTNNVINITGSNSIKTAAELIAAAKAKPGRLTYAYSTGSTQLAAELFQQAAGVKFTGVSYKSSGAGLTDVAGGTVDLFFIDDVSASPLYQSNKIRPLAVASPERIRSLPDVPSAREIGVPGYNIQPWFGVYVSSKTPPAIVSQLRDKMTHAMKTPLAVANLEKRGLTPMLVCGDAMTKLQHDEIELWRDVMKKAGIEAQ